MINLIKIQVTNLNKELIMTINPLEKEITTPFKTIKVNDDKIDYFLRIIRNWQRDYSGNIIDGERFIIKIIYNNQEEVIKGSGKYPDNYIEFKNFLEEYYD